MNINGLRVIVISAVLALPCFAEQPVAELSYEQHIRPIFREHCFDCHGAGEQLKGNLDLRLRRLIVAGGEGGPAIEPGNPEDSYLFQRVRDGEMPPGDKKLRPDQIETIRRWIAAGAPTLREEPQEIGKGIGITPEERSFWSFQPIVRPSVPEFDADERVRTPIDARLLAELKKHGLSFSADADKLTLIRRAYFDLLGLPPSPDDVQQFLADESDDAYEKLIDRLLESNHYGQRWARHWLDVAGYADSEGYTNADDSRPWAYKYRDYVIKSLNEDKPFDQFIQEQLAGDEMVPLPHSNLQPEQIDKLIATGFLRMAADGTGSGANNDEARNQTMADTIKIVSTGLLGLSVGCAQCHDHRYDPIPQTDYYRLRAVFEPGLDWKNWRTPQQRLVSLYTDADRAKAAEVEAEAQQIAAEKAEKQATYIDEALEKELTKFDETLREALRTAFKTAGDKRTPEQQELLKKYPSVNISPGTLYQYNQAAADELKKYDERIAETRKNKPVEEFIRVLNESPGNVSVTHLFHRGEFKQPRDPVSPGDLTVAAPPGERFDIADNDPSLPSTGRRLAYARWLTSGKHPLVARVLVNQIWLHHFGRGIVGTPGDFGVLGARPTHPELLDWLADEFMASGWQLKRLHKLIMTSTAYRQSSVGSEHAAAIDPDNQWYSRKPIQRLDAEALRDRILATSGMLSESMYGPPVPIKADETGQIVVDGDQSRRSIYLRVKRTEPVAMLTSFDAPVMEINCTQRPSSTVATQSLMLMNSDFILAQAAKFAERVNNEATAEYDPPNVEELQSRIAQLNSPWQFGYGEIDESSGRTASFAPLPHWTGSSWQGGPQLPDPEIGWVILNAVGGHAGNDAQHAAIRRWVAPRDGMLTIKGRLHHGSENGNGVRGRVSSSRSGLAGEWVAHHGEAETTVQQLAVQTGDAVDFVIDCRDDVTSDSFQWTIEVRMMPVEGGDEVVWNSQQGFHGPPPPSLARQVTYAWQLAFCRPAGDEEIKMSLIFLARQINHLRAAGHDAPETQAMTNLCQTLISANEFLYVD